MRQAKGKPQESLSTSPKVSALGGNTHKKPALIIAVTLALSFGAPLAFAEDAEETFPEFSFSATAEVEDPCPHVALFRQVTNFALDSDLSDYQDLCSGSFDHDLITVEAVPALPSHGLLEFTLSNSTGFMAVFNNDGEILGSATRTCQFGEGAISLELLIAPPGEDVEAEDHTFHVLVAENCYASVDGLVEFPRSFELNVELTQFAI
jgi:hypothetical protein